MPQPVLSLVYGVFVRDDFLESIVWGWADIRSSLIGKGFHGVQILVFLMQFTERKYCKCRFLARNI